MTPSYHQAVRKALRSRGGEFRPQSNYMGAGSGSGGTTSGVEPGSGSGFTGGTTSGSVPGPGSGSGLGSGSVPGTGGGGVRGGATGISELLCLSDAISEAADSLGL